MRRLLATVLAATLLVGCSTRKQYGVATHSDPVTGNCDHSRNIEVGASLDLSGPQGALGREYLTGMRMAVAHFNHSQGILSHHSCLELLYKDDRGDANIGDRAVLDLVNDEVVAFLVGPFESATVKLAGPDLGLAGVPNTSMSSLDDTRAPAAYPMTFPVAPSASTEAQSMVAYARSRGWSSVAVAVTDDPAGSEALAAVRSRAARVGITLTAVAAVRAGHAAADLGRLRASGPAGLLVLGDSLAVGPVLQARADLGWTVPTVASQVAADRSVMGTLDQAGRAGVSVLVPSAVVTAPGAAPSDPAMVSFLSQLRSQLGGAAIGGSAVPYAEGYDSVAMVAYAANSINSDAAGNVRVFLENAAYQGLLAAYGYSSGRHSGIVSSQLTVAPLASLSGGLLHVAGAGTSGAGSAGQ